MFPESESYSGKANGCSTPDLFQTRVGHALDSSMDWIGLDWVDLWEELHGLDWIGSDDR